VANPIDTAKCPECHSKRIDGTQITGLCKCGECGAILVRSYKEGTLGRQMYYIAPDRSGTQTYTSTSGLPHAGDKNT